MTLITEPKYLLAIVELGSAKDLTGTPSMLKTHQGTISNQGESGRAF